MIKFEKNMELALAMKNIMTSLLNVNNYLDDILDYTGKILTPKKEKELIKILKKYNIPNTNLKYDSNLLTNNPYYKDIKLNDIYSDKVRYENDTIKKRTLMIIITKIF